MNKATNNTFIYLLQIIISGLLMFVLMSIVSRYLSSEELGGFVLTQVYSGIAVGIANFGVLVGYERNFFIFEKSAIKSGELISTALIFVAFNLLLLTTLVYFYQSNINLMFFSNKIPSQMFLIVVIGTSMSSLSQYYLFFLKNHGMAKSYVKFTIINSVVNFIIAVVFLTQTNLKSMSLAYAWMASNLSFSTLLFYILSITCFLITKNYTNCSQHGDVIFLTEVS